MRLLTCESGHFWETGEGHCPKCGAPSDAAPLLDEPMEPTAPVEERPDADGWPTIVGYEIVEDLGRGPTGLRLYRAKHKVIGRPAILEVVLAKEDATQRAWGSLRTRAATLAKLAHPGVLQLWETGERERSLFFNATELVEGPTLTQKVDGKRLPTTQAVRLVEMLARTVDHAHAAGVHHRNLRPDAVRLQPTQMPLKLPNREDQPGAAVYLHGAAFLPRLDGFGLARKAEEVVDAELYGDQLGFISPEQAWGRAEDIGPTTDVWGLGAILYFLLTDHAPYEGDGVLEAVQSGDPGWSRLGGGDELRAIVRKAMTRAPSRRYTTAGAMADDLRRWMLSLPLSVREPTAGYVFGRWMRRRPAVATMLVMGVVSAAVAAGGYFVGMRQAWAAQTEAAAARNQMSSLNSQLSYTNGELNEFRRRERFVPYLRALAQAREQMKAGNRVMARQILDRQPAEDRGFEWVVTYEQSYGRERRTVVPAERKPTGGGWAGGQTVTTADRALLIGGTELAREVLTADEPYVAMSVNPDSKVVALLVGGRVECYTLADGDGPAQKRFAVVCPVKNPVAVSVAPDGGAVAIASAGGPVVTLDATTGRVEGRQVNVPQAADGKAGVHLAWTAQRQLAASRDGSTVVAVVDLIGRTPLRNVTGGSVTALTAREGLVAVAFRDKSVRLVEPWGVGEKAALKVPTAATRLAFNADGTRLAAACGASVVVFAKNGEVWQEAVTLDVEASAGLAFAPDREALLTVGPAGAEVWGR